MGLPENNASKRCRWTCKQCRPWSDCSSRSSRCSVIWVYIVSPDLSVRKLGNITINKQEVLNFKKKNRQEYLLLIAANYCKYKTEVLWPSQHYLGHFKLSVILITLCRLRSPKRLTSIKCTYFLTNVLESGEVGVAGECGEWRMAIEIISWPTATKVVWPGWGSNPYSLLLATGQGNKGIHASSLLRHPFYTFAVFYGWHSLYCSS